jgi:WD40 repeat protein
MMKSNPSITAIHLFGAILAALMTLSSCATSSPAPAEQEKARVAGPYAAPTSEPTIKVQTGQTWLVEGIALAGSANRIVTASGDQSLRVWDLATGKELRHLAGHTDAVTDLSVSADGRLALTAGGYDHTLRLWDLEAGTELRVIALENKMVNTVALSPDGSTAASGDLDGQVLLWNLRTNARDSRMLRMQGGCIRDLAFAPDGTGLSAVSDDGVLRIWAAASGGLVRSIKACEGKALCVAYSHDGSRIATGGEDGRATVWDATTGTQIWATPSSTGRTQSVCFLASADSLATAHSSGVIDLWNVASGAQKRLVRSTNKGNEPWNAIACSADGSLLAAGGNYGSIKVWDSTSMRQVIAIDPMEYMEFTEMTPDGKSMAITFWPGVVLWDIAGARTIKAFTQSNLRIPGMWHFANSRVTPEGKFLALAARTGGSGLSLWDGTTAQLITRFEGMPDSVERSAISPDGQLIAAASLKGPIYVWDTGSGAQLFTVNASVRDGTVNPLLFSPDSRLLASVDNPDKVLIWDARTGKSVGKVTTDWVWTFSFFPDSKKLLVGGQETIGQYNLGGHLMSALQGGHPHSYLTSSLVSADGKTAFTGSVDSIIHRWDLGTGKVVSTYAGHRGAPYRIAFNAETNRLVAKTEDLTIRVWNAVTGDLLCSSIIQTNGEYLTWTPEGYYSGSERLARSLVYVQTGDEISSIDQYNELLYRPDLVAAKVQNGVLPDAARTSTLPAIVARDGMPPKVEIVEPVSGDIASRDVMLKLRVTQRSGGIGKIVVSLDGMPVVLSEAGRGLSVVSLPGSDSSQTGEVWEAHISLRGGDNTVEVSATNKAGSIESAKDSRQYRVPQGLEGKPRLVMLLVAVTKYRDGALRLTYPVEDARAFKDTMLKSASTLYRDTSVIELFDDEATREGLGQAFDKAGELAGSQDTFVLYFAGHGVANEADGEYYFLPVDFRYRDQASISEQGISKKQILEDLLKVTAEKSILFFDTCNSGSFLSTPASRGLTEKTAVDRLKRAIGRAMIVASSDTQVALEGYKGHGVFTYALVDGLSGKADGDKNGYVSVKELSTYVENAVPELTYSTWGYEQLPQSLLPREDFPLAQDAAP